MTQRTWWKEGGEGDRAMLFFCVHDVVILQLHPFYLECTQVGLCSNLFAKKDDFSP